MAAGLDAWGFPVFQAFAGQRRARDGSLRVHPAQREFHRHRAGVAQVGSSADRAVRSLLLDAVP